MLLSLSMMMVAELRAVEVTLSLVSHYLARNQTPQATIPSPHFPFPKKLEKIWPT